MSNSTSTINSWTSKAANPRPVGLAGHRMVVLYLILFSLVSLFTIHDFPTVDKTNDDMWNVDWALTTIQDGWTHRTVNLLPALNQIETPFNLNTATAVIAFRYFGQTVFTQRVKNLIIGIVLLIFVYAFAYGLFGDVTWALLATIGTSMTNAFLYRSHDARYDIIAALFFFFAFALSYQLVVRDDESKRFIRVMLLTIVLLVFFRQVHLNGAIAGVISFTAVLIGCPRILTSRQSWAGLGVGLILYGAYDFCIGLLSAHSSAAAGRPAMELGLRDLLVVVPVYAVSSFQSVGGVLKSIYHILALIVRYPVRFVRMIDRETLTAYIDFVLLALLSVAVISRFAVKRRGTPELRFLLVWLVLYVVGMAFFCGSNSDYSIYVMPVVVLTILVCIRDIAEARGIAWRPWVMGLVGIQVALMIGLLIKLKYVDRYYDHYRQIDAAMSSTLTSRASVLGAPLYFTMLKPKMGLDYREIYQSIAPTDPFFARYFDEAHFDFATEFRKKRFDFVIYDEFFDRVVKSEGFGIRGKSFKDSLLTGYDLIRTIDTDYPCSHGAIKHIEVYRLQK